MLARLECGARLLVDLFEEAVAVHQPGPYDSDAQRAHFPSRVSWVENSKVCDAQTGWLNHVDPRESVGLGLGKPLEILGHG